MGGPKQPQRPQSAGPPTNPSIHPSIHAPPSVVGERRAGRLKGEEEGDGGPPQRPTEARGPRGRAGREEEQFVVMLVYGGWWGRCWLRHGGMVGCVPVWGVGVCGVGVGYHGWRKRGRQGGSIRWREGSIGRAEAACALLLMPLLSWTSGGRVRAGACSWLATAAHTQSKSGVETTSSIRRSGSASPGQFGRAEQ